MVTRVKCISSSAKKKEGRLVVLILLEYVLNLLESEQRWASRKMDGEVPWYRGRTGTVVAFAVRKY